MTRKRFELSSYIEDFLTELKGKQVCYYPNPGNAGDSLIATATYQAFHRNNIVYEVIDGNKDVSGQIVFLGGGGNLIPTYSNISQVIGKFSNTASKLIILPHTIRENVDLLLKLPKSTVVFCRDPESYNHVIDHAECSIELVHDIALSLDLDQFYHDCSRYGDVRSLFSSISSKNSINFHENSYTFYRLDTESKFNLKTNANNVDLSKLFEFGVYPDNAQKSSWCLLEAIRLANCVHTDRLHVGISAAILGQSCNLLDNNYGKNKGIYNHSIRRFCASNFSFSTIPADPNLLVKNPAK